MTLRLLRLLLPSVVRHWRSPETLATFAAAVCFIGIASAPLAELAWQAAPVLQAVDGPSGVARTVALVSFLLLLPTPLIAMAFREGDHLSGGWRTLEPLLALPIPRPSLMRSAAIVAALTDVPGWIALLWSVWMFTVSLEAGLWRLLLALPFLLLLLSAWHLQLLVADLAMRRWLSAAWRRRLPRLASLAVFAGVLAACVRLVLVTRGRDRLFEAVTFWTSLEPAREAVWLWPLTGILSGLETAGVEFASTIDWLLHATVPSLLMLSLLPLLAHLGLRCGLLSLVATVRRSAEPAPVPLSWPAAAEIPGGTRVWSSPGASPILKPGFSNPGPRARATGSGWPGSGFAMLDRPDRFRLALVGLVWTVVTGAGLADDTLPLWLLAGFGPVLAAAAGVVLFRDAMREVLLLRLPVRPVDYLAARAGSAASMVLFTLLPPVLVVHAGSGLQPLLFPVGWGILATVAAGWTGVIAGAVLYPAGARAGTLRTMLGLFLLASILGPMVAAGSLSGFPQALWAIGIQLMALARLWQVACHRYRWLEDPEPPPGRGAELDVVVWVFLGLTLVTPLLAQVMESAGVGGRAAPGLVMLCLTPVALGAVSLLLRAPVAGTSRGLAAGAVAGLALLAWNLAYNALSGWLGWTEPLRAEGAGELLRLLADQPWAVVAGGVLTATVIPVGEELFFRGLLFPSLRDSAGERQAYLVSSLAFALVHPLAHAPFTLVFGLVASWLYVRWGGLAAPVVAHLVCNGAIIMTSLLR